jgi:hypothetical protein
LISAAPVRVAVIRMSTVALTTSVNVASTLVLKWPPTSSVGVKDTDVLGALPLHLADTALADGAAAAFAAAAEGAVAPLDVSSGVASLRAGAVDFCVDFWVAVAPCGAATDGAGVAADGAIAAIAGSPKLSTFSS